jgi:DNA-binding GntR family transcriptional regulator
MTSTAEIERALREHLAALDDSVLGERFYSEHELQAMYGGSRVTIRTAVQRLVSDGMLSVRHGVGTVVLRRFPRAGQAPSFGDLTVMTDEEFVELAERVHRETRRRLLGGG